jgi:hypothetical protein
LDDGPSASRRTEAVRRLGLDLKGVKQVETGLGTATYVCSSRA